MHLETIWPPYALTLRCGDMELSPVRESDYAELADLARGGVREHGVQAFLIDWDSGTDEEVARSIAQYQWGTRARFAVDEWTLEFAVRVAGRVVGVQGVSAGQYPKTRAVNTGSWLAREHQGKGFGTRMRAAIVAAFAEHFGADVFYSAYLEGNTASRRVSEKLGYSPNGEKVIVAQNGESVIEHQLVLKKGDFVQPAEPVLVTGAEPFRRFIGIA